MNSTTLDCDYVGTTGSYSASSCDQYCTNLYKLIYPSATYESKVTEYSEKYGEKGLSGMYECKCYVCGDKTKVKIPEKLEHSEDYSKSLSNEQVLNARQKYEVSVLDWSPPRRSSHYNPNIGESSYGDWSIYVFKITNNNERIKLPTLTIRLNGGGGWGRWTIEVSTIEPGATKEFPMWVFGDLLSDYPRSVELEKEISSSDYRFFDELN